MKKEFVPYEQALELKELGFDEKCFGSWEVDYTKTPTYTHSLSGFYKNSNHPLGKVSAPLYQQAFRWFREKHNLDSFVKAEWQQTVKVGYYFSANDYYSAQPSYITYEEAQLECLKKLLSTLNQK